MTKKRKHSRTRRLSNSGTNSETEKATREFWHGPTALPDRPSKAQVAEDAAAVIHSLGAAPLNGQEDTAEHYFDAIYHRSVTLAAALATAAELAGDDEDEPIG